MDFAAGDEMLEVVLDFGSEGQSFEELFLLLGIQFVHALTDLDN